MFYMIIFLLMKKIFEKKIWLIEEKNNYVFYYDIQFKLSIFINLEGNFIWFCYLCSFKIENLNVIL